jgi:hypothetical protein
MSESARTVTWAGGTHTFDLNSERVSWMLQQSLRPFPGQYGDTPAAAFKRFDEGVYSPDDIENVFRIGLIGGGMSDDEAEKLIAQHVRNKPLATNAIAAQSVLYALFFGEDDVSASA